MMYVRPDWCDCGPGTRRGLHSVLQHNTTQHTLASSITGGEVTPLIIYKCHQSNIYRMAIKTLYIVSIMNNRELRLGLLMLSFVFLQTEV